MLKFSLQFFATLLLTFLLTLNATAQTEKSSEENGQIHSEIPPAKPFVNTSAVLPKNFPVPGGIAVVPLNMRNFHKPTVKFGSRDVLVVPHQNQWHAVVGLPIDILPGNYILGTLDHEDETGKVAMRVITLPPPPQSNDGELKKNLSAKLTSRGAIPIQLDETLSSTELAKSQMRISDGLLSEERELIPSFVFSPVVESEQVIPFGKILQEKNIIVHNYLSFIGRSDAQVYSPAPGIVVKVIEDQGRNGKLYINHGGGIISVLANLEKVLVQEGQSLDRGEQVGRANFDGSLDRSRIDYGLSLNGFFIDPLQLPSSP